MTNPLLKDDMVIWKGEDPRRGHCYFVYQHERNDENKRSICFPDMLPIVEKLGLEVTTHWSPGSQVAGYYAVRGLKYYRATTDQLRNVFVDPIVEKILTDNMVNKEFKILLSQEND